MFHRQGMPFRSRSFSPTQSKGSSNSASKRGRRMQAKDMSSKPESTVSNNVASRDDESNTILSPSRSSGSATRRVSFESHVPNLRSKSIRTLSVDRNIKCEKISSKEAALIAYLTKEQAELVERISTLKQMIEIAERRNEWLEKSNTATLETLLDQKDDLQNLKQGLSQTCHTLGEKIHHLRKENEFLLQNKVENSSVMDDQLLCSTIGIVDDESIDWYDDDQTSLSFMVEV